MFYAFIISVHHRVFNVFTLKTFVVNQQLRTQKYHHYSVVLFSSKSCWEVLIIAELLQEHDENTPLSGLNQQRRADLLCRMTSVIIKEHKGLSLRTLLFHSKPIGCLQLWIAIDCAARRGSLRTTRLNETATSHNHLHLLLFKGNKPPPKKTRIHFSEAHNSPGPTTISQ